MKLSREQRNRIFARQQVRIAGIGKCPVELGDVIPLSTRVSIRVEQIRRNRRNEWSLVYVRIDFRDLYLLPSAHSIRMTPKGEPLMSEAEAHGYTSNRLAAIDAGLVLDIDHNQTVSPEARLKRIEMERSNHPEQQAAEDVRRVKDELAELVKRAAKLGVDPVTVIAPIAREIQVQHENLRDAA